MIISRITDGLGNQMFQYANGRARSLDKRTSFTLDTSWYSEIETRFTTREFQLDLFNIEASIVPPAIATAFKYPDLPRGIRSVYYRIQDVLPYYKRRFVKEMCFGYDLNISKIKKNAYMQGFWQSYKYFENHRTQIVKEFSLKNESNAFLAKRRALQSSHSVSLHVRRGDYCNREQNPQHCLLGQEYYCSALDLMKSNVGQACVYVFSDDSNWAKQTFVGEQFHFMDAVFTAPEEMMLMSSCKHNIIANSTFSWWAAWLNVNPQKIVVAPQRWFENNDKSTQDLLPTEWIFV